MAEIFWDSWVDGHADETIGNLFNAILLKKESAFPDQIIVPEFNENEKIVLTTHIPSSFTLEENKTLMYIMSRVIDLIPDSCQKTLLISSGNQEISEIWKKTFSFSKLLSEDVYIEIKKPVKEFSPFSTVQPKPDYLSNWYLPLEVDSADQLIPVIPFKPSSPFQVLGVISSFFWFLPTKIKNEILIQKTPEKRAIAFMEIASQILPKITLSGILYQGTKNFAVFGNDPASVDAFASALMSVKASSVETTKYCRKHKIGIGDLLKIHVQGERFKKPVVRDNEVIKNKFELYFDPALCNLCKICIDSCPLQAIFTKDKQLFYVKSNCVHCGFCFSICPQKSIKII
jgi:NAD-dependent dihydropyrimidine dehydrogenase PreA subunit